MKFIKYLLKLLQAYLNKEPGREQILPPETRISYGDKYTKDEIAILKDFLSLNRYSRPGRKRKGVKGIEIHWVANPMSSAKANQGYFETRSGGESSYGSYHFIIDINGDKIQMIPENEIAYSSGAKKYMPGIQKKLGRTPYDNTVSIGCCHKDWSGKMTDETMRGLARMTVHLCKKYNLLEDDVYLHYDITGKICHKWFVENEHEWVEFKNWVGKAI